jgi:ABC-type oligopeptide transport system substrate-binding subunit
MKKMLLISAIVMLLGSAALFACSDNKKAESEKGAIEKMTDKTATEVVNRIRTPIDKAQSVKNQQEDRLRDMEKTLKEQE